MPTATQTGTQNNISIKVNGTKIYGVRTYRDTGQFALTTAGDAALQAAIHDGLYPHELVVEDNGATIAANTVPPQVKPAAPALSAPTGLTATASSSTAISLGWTAASGATGYLVERSTNGTSGWAQIGTSATTSYSDTGLTASTGYYYRVRSTSSSSTSAYSSTANATTQAAITIYPAYSQTVLGPDGRFIYPAGSGNTASTDLAFTGAPKADSNYAFSLTYETNLDSGSGVAGLQVNGGAVQATINLEAASGGSRTVTGTLSLSAGANTITFTLNSGTLPYQVKSMIITRPAGA